MNGHRSDLTKKTLLPVSEHFVTISYRDVNHNIELYTLYYSNIYVHLFINNMKRMRKCNDEIYQLAKDQALVKKLCPPEVMFVTWLTSLTVTSAGRNA
jgi:hypothetical protein